MNIKLIVCLALVATMISNLSLPAIAEEGAREDEVLQGQEVFSSEGPESQLPVDSEFSDGTMSEAGITDTGVERRIESRQERRTDVAENLNDGSEDRQEFREGRRDSVGEGPEARVENRENKRENRRGRGDDRRQDRTDRVNDRF